MREEVHSGRLVRVSLGGLLDDALEKGLDEDDTASLDNGRGRRGKEERMGRREENPP